MTGPFLAYVEWVLDMRLTEAQRMEAEAELQRIFGEGSKYEIKLVTDAVTAYRDLDNHSEGGREALRPSVEDEWLKMLRNRVKKVPLARWVTGVNDAQRPVVRGRPSPSRQAAEAAAEMMALVVNETGGEAQADKAWREAFAKALAARYKKYNGKQKAALAQMPRTWAELRAAWAELSDEKKSQLRNEWRASLAQLYQAPGKASPVTPEIPVPHSTGAGTGVATGKPAIKVEPEQPAFQDVTRGMVARAADWI
jgi:hypothetical protein